MRKTATLGLGGNIGDPPASMAAALRMLDATDGISVSAVSRLYRTPPWGKTDQDWFFNCCAIVETSCAPRALLDACLDIEKRLKRKRRERWGPRIIDIDVLTFDDLEVREDGLIIPHPHMHERAFVLLPLTDIAASMELRGEPVSQWAARCDSAGIEIASEDGKWWKETGA
ncbi:2-amino-4-hydroxy-6-hydroxymethyldihydropteridine diphosphokinase [Hoeflea poritis]|uniref:2-amino-4-hydroxy-6-hydroxymethyldihydropteridine pyrophosphokinase n=1 Tax=Hoeflea poritis TaxID=2993659 RepID=A0ABT4VU68_9HYPH|nr:2-amino-4-hydroxy-6-hydroxymethyldihydropteridine diphosphokinase [Hoeflea poritis]MDA4848255.1 2-amino-4-hydroxy-6-hydroxymethyldihydropteridine diphosphokinase [Hoeflea poritis]